MVLFHFFGRFLMLLFHKRKEQRRWNSSSEHQGSYFLWSHELWVVVNPCAQCRWEAKRVLLRTAAAALWISALSTSGPRVLQAARTACVTRGAGAVTATARIQQKKESRTLGTKLSIRIASFVGIPQCKVRVNELRSSWNTAGLGLGAGCTVPRENRSSRIQSWKFKLTSTMSSLALGKQPRYISSRIIMTIFPACWLNSTSTKYRPLWQASRSLPNVKESNLSFLRRHMPPSGIWYHARNNSPQDGKQPTAGLGLMCSHTATEPYWILQRGAELRYSRAVFSQVIVRQLSEVQS